MPLARGLARFPVEPGPIEPDARLVMPVGLPVVLEVAHHSAVAYLPQQQPVFLDLLHGWLRHKKRSAGRSQFLVQHLA